MSCLNARIAGRLNQPYISITRKVRLICDIGITNTGNILWLNMLEMERLARSSPVKAEV